METLIDGDLASNNGGWQWSASTGVDPVPYFRIFNPYTQSKKVDASFEFGLHPVPLTHPDAAATQADPTGEYIRYFVPELSKVFGDGMCCAEFDFLALQLTTAMSPLRRRTQPVCKPSLKVRLSPATR